MSIIQMLLLAFVTAFCKLEGGWFGECKLREPIITGFLTGLILGDPAKGLMIGAELQLIWMGAAAIGPVTGLDIITGCVLGTAVAITTGQGLEAAMLFGVPASLLMQFIGSITCSLYSFFNVMVDKEIAAHKFDKVAKIHYFVGFLGLIQSFLVMFVALLFSNAVSAFLANGLPEWINSGLAGVAALLPMLGFAILFKIIYDRELIPFFIIGFVLAAFSGVGHTMVSIAMLAFAIAWIMFIIFSKIGSSANLSVKDVSDDEWED